MKCRRSGLWLGALLALLLPVIPARTAEPSLPVGMVEQPCPAPLPMPASSRTLLGDLFMRPRVLVQSDFNALMGDREFAAYNEELRRRGATDWAGLCRFQAANAALKAGTAKVVFIGDSITENWLLADPAYFSGALVNRGIGAQTSAQMLMRFRADVVALHPAAVHILAGTNDVAGNNGPVRPQDFQNNIESMVEVARENGIRVILGSIPPSAAFNWQPTLKPAPRIEALNDWMRGYARRNGLSYIDYHAALKGSAGELRQSLGNDGVHPNRDGYAIMRQVAAPTIDAVLSLPVKPSLAADHWVASWGTAQQLMMPDRVIPSAQTPPARVVNQTVRMVARPTLAGSQLRVSLSNSFGYGPVRIKAVQVARTAAGGGIQSGTGKALTFGGNGTVVLPPGARISSDPALFDVRAQEDLSVSIYVEGDSGPTTSHPIGLRAAWLAPGNQVDAVSLKGETPFRSYLWLDGVEVKTAADSAALIAFGDSITDGFSTTPDADMAWPSVLARRLGAQGPGAARSVINMGISGNRVLREGAGSSGLARFDRDVLSRPGARWVLLFLGINDIGFSAIPGLPDSEKATAEEIIAGMQLFVSRARMQGLVIMSATLMPFEGVNSYTPAGEKMRQQVNDWIRSSGAFDAVVDFDKVARDPSRPTRLRAEFDSGDHIHPNDAGNRAMADSIDLGLFR